MSTLIIAMLLHWPFWLVVLLALVGLAHEWIEKKLKGYRPPRVVGRYKDYLDRYWKRYNQKVNDTTKK
jgi:hypothetical protein